MVRKDQAVVHECYVLRKVVPRAPLVNITLTIKGNLLKKPLSGKQTSNATKDELKNLFASKDSFASTE